MSTKTTVVGIDLGTTNSEVAAFVGGRVRVLGPDASKMLPSCVGLSPAGELLIGRTARNQQLLYPERTVRSVKRKMGSAEAIRLGDRTFTPQEISALILRELAAWAAKELGEPVAKAVITVPAYFSDAQRNATREAGALAGLEVLRIVNEPTAASLAYGYDRDEQRRTVMIYDLGGGTFDVSIATIEQGVTEVRASHGNNQLGGDDFNDLLLERLLGEFRTRHGIDLRSHPAAFSRLWWAAEECKKRLSAEPYAVVREEALVMNNGRPLHLELEVRRDEYEDMIRPLVESTLESVARAMQDAGTRAGDLDAVLLVGGSTRTPLVQRVLKERLGVAPRQDVHPDLCVAFGAGVLAARLAGEETAQVLVDVSPYSFGPCYLGERDGRQYPYCYHPVITRNTPLPVTRTDRYFTASPFQSVVELNIYQGDDPDALRNTLVGTFKIEGLQETEEPNEVLCQMRLDVDGILQVTAIEKCTGLSKRIMIANAFKHKDDAELRAVQERLRELFQTRAHAEDGCIGEEPVAFESADLVFQDEDGGEVADTRASNAAPSGAETPADTGQDVPKAAAAEQPAPEPTAAAPKAPPADREAPHAPQDAHALETEARQVVERARALFERMHADDREEAVNLTEGIEAALAARDRGALSSAMEELRELLFFVEGA